MNNITLMDFMKDYVEYLIEKVRKRISKYVDNVDKFLVGFSGGKDSTALLLIANKYFRNKMYVVYYHVVGNAHFSNVNFINYVTARLGLKRVVIRIARYKMLDKPKLPEPPALLHVISLGGTGKGFWSDLKKYGFPDPKELYGNGQRWCTAHFKYDPSDKLVDYYKIRIILNGVKATDSRYRKKHIQEHGWVLYRGYYIGLRPMYDLNDVDVWMIIKYLDNDIYEKLTSIYNKFGGAINCIICPLMSSNRMKKLYKTLDPNYVKQAIKLLNEVPAYGSVSQKLKEKILEELKNVQLKFSQKL